ncbi:MAG: M90 family metallopeptidase [Pseudomonadota bacterium]
MIWLLPLLALGTLGFFGARALARRRMRAALLAAPLTDEERALLARHVPLLDRLPPELRPALEGKINRFLHQVQFVGCDGQEVTEAMRLSIAAQACLLIVNVDRWYDTLRTILIYPGAFKSHQKQQDGFIVHERDEIRSGESWVRGPIVLSWPHSEQGARNDRDGHNVVLHEFAHQIDQLSGHTDGAPLMNKGQSFAEWSRVFLEAFERHQARVDKGARTVLDAYGATAHEEFFAVAVELFFERPDKLQADVPEVYDQLVTLFKLDPSTWTAR